HPRACKRSDRIRPRRNAGNDAGDDAMNERARRIRSYLTSMRRARPALIAGAVVVMAAAAAAAAIVVTRGGDRATADASRASLAARFALLSHAHRNRCGMPA